MKEINKFIFTRLKWDTCLLFISVFIWVIIIFYNGFFCGYRATFVVTGSMEPVIPIASLLIEQKYDKNYVLKEGDVITFRPAVENSSSRRITHRIVRLEGEYIYTKGDANPENDVFPICKSDVESKVVYIYPYFLQTLTIIVTCGIIISFFKKRQ